MDSCRNYINDTFGNNYLPDDPTKYGSKEGAQEAHWWANNNSLCLTAKR